MTHLPIQGLFAAVATPVRDDGRFDEAAFDRLVDMLVGAGVDGICIGGATGEYPHFESAARVTVIERAAERLPADKILLVGIGAASLRKTIELGKAALAAAPVRQASRAVRGDSRPRPIPSQIMPDVSRLPRFLHLKHEGFQSP